MTSRERVLAALRHEQPDRVPRDFWAEPPTWNRLLAHTGLAEKDQLLDRLDVDVRHLEAPTVPNRQIDHQVFQNFWGERFVMDPTPWGPMRHDVKGALARAQTFSEIEAFEWPNLVRRYSEVLGAKGGSWHRHICSSLACHRKTSWQFMKRYDLLRFTA